MSNYPTDLEIANAAHIKPIEEIANSLDINSDDLIRYGNDKAKLSTKIVKICLLVSEILSGVS